MDDMVTGTSNTSKKKDTGLSQASMQAMICADSSMKQAKVQGSMATHDIKPIDLVVVNLYPFKETIAKPNVTEAEAIENIDIGGPAMVRASAKNFRDVIIVTNPARYTSLIAMLQQYGDADIKTRKTLAKEAFNHTSEYDAMICEYLTKQLVEGK